MDDTKKRSFRQQIVALLELNADGEYSAADVVSDLCELVERGGPKTTAVRIVHRVDVDPNLSWLGEYMDAVPSGVADWQVVDREEKGELRRGERRYFVGGANYKAELEAEGRTHTLQDYERVESYNRGDWTMLGVSVEADIEVDTGVECVMQTITSGGLWGVESDGDDAHRREVAGRAARRASADSECPRCSLDAAVARRSRSGREVLKPRQSPRRTQKQFQGRVLDRQRDHDEPHYTPERCPRGTPQLAGRTA